MSKASDLYATAVMAYELLIGTRPFEGPNFLEQKLNRAFVPIESRDPTLPKALGPFFARAFEPDPTRRFPNAQDFIKEFHAATQIC